MNIQQFEAWKNAPPAHKKEVLRTKKLRLTNLTKLIAKMERNL